MHQVQCPICSFTMVNNAPGEIVACPGCGNRVQMPQHEQSAPLAKRREPRERSTAIPKNAGAAAVLSFLIPGMGQMLNGEVGKGLLIFFLLPVLMAASIMAFVVLGAKVPPILLSGPFLPIGWFCLWVYQIFDAFQAADRYNKRNGFR